MTGECQITLHNLGTEDYDEILALWERAGLSVRPEGRDAPECRSVRVWECRSVGVSERRGDTESQRNGIRIT